MNSKHVSSSTAARNALKSGVDQLADAVKVTFGPKGRNVIIEQKLGSPIITKDGVTVAKEVELVDPIENMGAQMVKAVAAKTSDLAGDGTTTATILAQAIFREGLAHIAAGANPMSMKRGIDKAVRCVVTELARISVPVREVAAADRRGVPARISPVQVQLGEMAEELGLPTLPREIADHLVSVDHPLPRLFWMLAPQTGYTAAQLRRLAAAAQTWSFEAITATSSSAHRSPAELLWLQQDPLARVGTISANSDEEVGGLIADVMGRVGAEGYITIEEGKSIRTTVSIVEGMQFDRGYLSPYFTTDPARMEVVLQDTFILVRDGRISSLKELLPLLGKVAQTGRPLLLVAEDVEGEALATLVVNKLRGTLRLAAVKAPGFGEHRKGMLQDVVAMTGGQLVSDEGGLTLANVDLSHFGSARTVVITKDSTTIIGGAGDERQIQSRVGALRTQIDKADSDLNRERLQERLARMVSGVAVIQVGAPTESAMKEKKARMEDALRAMRAAIQEGVVPGGGVALLRAQRALRDFDSDDPDERTGMGVIKRALEEPMRQISQNAGIDGAIVVATTQLSQNTNFGYNALTGTYEDLVDAGVIDATKVTRTALQNAASLAGLLLTTEYAFAHRRDRTEDTTESTVRSSGTVAGAY